MKKLLGILVLGFMLNGCAGESGPGGLGGLGGLMKGQWKPAISVGDNLWMVEGFMLQDAIQGANAHCAKSGKKMYLKDSKRYGYTQVFFECN